MRQYCLKIILWLYILWMFFIFLNMRMPPILIENYLASQPVQLKRDWHDYKAMCHDARRNGPGEQGKRAILSVNTSPDLEKSITMRYGYNGFISDIISVNRSLHDTRNLGCRNKQYLVKLPTISVVIPFNNEYFSVLVRTVHSLINRTPPELLKEIILVDDFSQYEDLGQKLDEYVAAHFDKVQIMRLPERMGLIRARLIGIRRATAEVLVIFDSHIEVNYNWLPPLLEPIALNKRTVVCPLIDRIAYDSFEYRFSFHGVRGGFDWFFMYVQLPVLPEDSLDRTKPYKTPVMMGGLFAISADFFWELGGYDEGLDVWGGEQYELSFKIWMCGGQLLDAPCSRVGHLYRDPKYIKPNPRGKHYVEINFKRVAEVWMDEYKNYIFKRNKDVYSKIDAGDLTAQKALREKLQCKSFKWYLEEVAFDVVKKYPPFDPPHYAYGTIQNVASPNLCIDTLNRPVHAQPGLFACARSYTNPQENQLFALTVHRDLRLPRTYTCLEVRKYEKNAPVWMWRCHFDGGNQFWFYDRMNKWLRHGQNGRYCLEASPGNREVFVNICQKDNRNMQWNFGVVNDTALDRFFENI